MERMWHYIHENNQKGPVSQDQLQQLLQQGIIQKDTYVWTEGMADWQPIAGLDFSAELGQGAVQKPTSVTVFGILNIVFGGLGLLCAPFGIMGLLLPQPGVPEGMYSPAMKGFLFFSYGLGIIMAGVLLTAGIGLLNLRRWARQLTYFYGWFAIGWHIISLVTTLLLMISGLSGAGESAPAVVGGIVGGACGGLLGLIYPIFIVVYMRKSTVVAACNR